MRESKIERERKKERVGVSKLVVVVMLDVIEIYLVVLYAIEENQTRNILTSHAYTQVHIT